MPRGFTLVEMIVVLAIITLLTLVALVSQNSFNRSILLTNSAYTIALSIRQAQSLGLSSRQYVPTSGLGVRNAGYGISIFGTTPLYTYPIFADIGGARSTVLDPYCPPGATGTPEEKPGNCQYNAGVDGVIQTYRLDRGFYVTQYCGRQITTGNPLRCSNDSTPLTELNVVFRRPNTETIASGRRSSTVIALSGAAIYIAAPNSSVTRGICISSVGQVSVTNGTCPI